MSASHFSQYRQPLRKIGRFKLLEPLESNDVADAVFFGQRIDDHPAADSDLRRVTPDDKAIARKRAHLLFESELNNRVSAGLNRRPFRITCTRPRAQSPRLRFRRVDGPKIRSAEPRTLKYHHPGHGLRRSVVESYSSALDKWTRCRGEELETRVYHRGRPQPAGWRKQAPAFDLLDVHTLKVNGGALTCQRTVGVETMHLDIADSRFHPSGQDF